MPRAAAAPTVVPTTSLRPEAQIGEPRLQPGISLIPSQSRVDAAPAPHTEGDEMHRTHPPLVDRDAEQGALRELLENARAGMGGALVLRGDAGIGKSTLLEQAIGSTPELQTLRVVAVESEMALGFAVVHQLVRPLLPALDRLPEPQRR